MPVRLHHLIVDDADHDLIQSGKKPYLLLDDWNVEVGDVIAFYRLGEAHRADHQRPSFQRRVTSVTDWSECFALIACWQVIGLYADEAAAMPAAVHQPKSLGPGMTAPAHGDRGYVAPMLEAA